MGVDARGRAEVGGRHHASFGGVALLVGAALGWVLASSVGGDAYWWVPFVVLYAGALMVWLPLRYRRRAT